jgi:hypothetical protein
MGECPKGVSGERLKRGPGWVAGALVFAISFTAREAEGQHCEVPERPESAPIEATLRAEAAHYETESSRGWYEGLRIRLGFHYEPLRLYVRVPYYRLLHPTGTRSGFGDVDSKLEATLHELDRWSLGAAASAAFPTGSAEDQLGMGHVMVGPSIWARRQGERLFAGAELGYQHAFGDSDDEDAALGHEHHEHAARREHAGAIPNPMNREEAWLGIGSGYAILPELRINVGAFFAVPVTEEGSTRGTATMGAEFPLGRVATALGVELDFLGPIRREVSFVSFSIAP